MLDPQYVWEMGYKRWKRLVASGKTFPISLHEIENRVLSIKEALKLIEAPVADIEARLTAAETKHLQLIWRSLPLWRRLLPRPPDYQLRALSAISEPSDVITLKNEIFQIRKRAWPFRQQLQSLEVETEYLEAYAKECVEDEVKQTSIKERQSLLAERRQSRLESAQQLDAEQKKRSTIASHFDRALFSIRNKDYKRGNPLDNHVRQAIREVIVAAFASQCIRCNSADNLVFDHYAIPKNEGGNFVLYDAVAGRFVLNVAVLCNSCNSAKGERNPFEVLSIDKIERIHAIHESLLLILKSNQGLRETLAKWYEIDGLAEIQFAMACHETR